MLWFKMVVSIGIDALFIHSIFQIARFLSSFLLSNTIILYLHIYRIEVKELVNYLVRSKKYMFFTYNIC